MGILSELIAAAGKMPGGGAGGGPNRNLFPTPEPQAILGVNSTVVYGSNVQVAMPINFQLAVGGNLQVCISPNAWQMLCLDGTSEAVVPTGSPDLNRVLGSGLGGNMQFTMGTNANFVLGQSFDVNFGPRRITLDVHNKAGVQACIGTLGQGILFATGAFILVYAIAADDDTRSWIVMIYQFLMQIMILCLMDTQTIYHHMDAIYIMQLNTLYSKDPVQATKDNQPDADAFGITFDGESEFGAVAKYTGIVSVLLLPILLGIGGESRLDTPQPPEAVVDSSGNTIGHVDPGSGAT
jgi:hypothetical protein